MELQNDGVAVASDSSAAILTWGGEAFGSVGIPGSGETSDPNWSSARLKAAAWFAVMQFGSAGNPLGLKGGDDLRAFRPSDLVDTSDPDFGRSFGMVAGYELRDVWFSSETELNLRLERSKSASGTKLKAAELRFYQVVADPRGDLRRLAKVQLGGAGMTVATVRLVNPLLPVLVTAVADDIVQVTDLIAFPSLCRGGLHSAEMTVSAMSGDYVADLAELSGALAAKLVRRRLGNRRGVRVSADLTNVTGGERGLTRGVLEWLTRTMDVSIRFETGEDGSAAWPTELLAAIDVAAIDRGEDLDGAPAAAELAIPVDAVPTIAVLVESSESPNLGTHYAEPQFLVADPVTYVGRWQIQMPVAQLRHVDAGSSSRTYPALRNLPKADVSEIIGKPSVIRFPVLSTPEDLRLLYWSDARERSDEPPRRVRAIVFQRRGSPDPAASMAGLRNQDGAEIAIDTIPLPDGPAARADNAERDLAARIDDLVANAPEDDILLLESGTVLQDPRTVSLLARLLADEAVGTVGCMLLSSGSGRLVSLHSAGVFPSDVSFLTPAAVTLVEPHADFPLWGTTYPVVANRSSALMTKAGLWRELGGLGGSRAGERDLDVDFGLRVLTSGRLNLCTTLVSAALPNVPIRRHRLSLHAPGLRAVADLATTLASATTLRRL